jgi:hypothetical protein
MSKIKSKIFGVGNKSFHQYIISDLVYGARKYLAKKRLSKKYMALSEISLSQIGYETTPSHFSRDFNIDFVVINQETTDLIVLIEIERVNINITATKQKIKECLQAIPSIEDAFIIYFDMNGKTYFERCILENGVFVCKPIKIVKTTLGIPIKASLISVER